MIILHSSHVILSLPALSVVEGSKGLILLLLLLCSTVLGKELLKGTIGLLQGLAQHRHLLTTELQSGRGICHTPLLHFGTKLGNSLNRCMKDNERIAILALELEQQ